MEMRRTRRSHEKDTKKSVRSKRTGLGVEGRGRDTEESGWVFLSGGTVRVEESGKGEGQWSGGSWTAEPARTGVDSGRRGGPASRGHGSQPLWGSGSGPQMAGANVASLRRGASGKFLPSVEGRAGRPERGRRQEAGRAGERTLALARSHPAGWTRRGGRAPTARRGASSAEDKTWEGDGFPGNKVPPTPPSLSPFCDLGDVLGTHSFIHSFIRSFFRSFVCPFLRSSELSPSEAGS